MQPIAPVKYNFAYKTLAAFWFLHNNGLKLASVALGALTNYLFEMFVRDYIQGLLI